MIVAYSVAGVGGIQAWEVMHTRFHDNILVMNLDIETCPTWGYIDLLEVGNT